MPILAATALFVTHASAGEAPTPRASAVAGAALWGALGLVGEPPPGGLLRGDVKYPSMCGKADACAAVAPPSGVAANHYMLDASGCPFGQVDAAAPLAAAMRAMASGAGLAPGAGTVEKEFVPQGVTILHLQHAGHVTVHTWPEHGAALFDLLAPAETSTTPEEAERALLAAAADLGCTRSGLRRVARETEALVAPAVLAAFETPLAKHVFVDASGCPAATLADPPSLIGAADECARAANLTEVGMVTRFSTSSPERSRAGAAEFADATGPWANSRHLAKLMEESHVAVHALPSTGEAYLDVMTCAPLSGAQVDEIQQAAANRLGCAMVAVRVEERGI